MRVTFFFKTSDFPHLILQLQLDGWLGMVVVCFSFNFTPLEEVIFEKHFDN